MGADERIRRYGTSRPFWNNPTKAKRESQKTRTNRNLSYEERIDLCGSSVNILEVNESLDIRTGEIETVLSWKDTIDVPTEAVLENLYDPGNPKRKRRSLFTKNLQHVKQIIENAAHKGELARRDEQQCQNVKCPTYRQKHWPKDGLVLGQVSIESHAEQV